MDVGLARVSSLDQNPQLQLDALSKAGCWPIYEERVSGKEGMARPVRDQVLKELGAGDTLTTWKLDRLGRSIIELHQIVADLKRRGIEYRSLTESVDTSTNQGRFFFALLAAFAEFERAMLVERTLAGKAQRTAAGLHPGGHRLFGEAALKETYKEQATPEQVAKEQALLRDAASHVLDGKPLAHLVDRWNKQQIPTKSGRGRWSETMVRRMLVNPRVAPIVGTDVHADLVRLFAPAAQRQHQGAPAVNLLAGILQCAICSQPMYRAVQNKKRVYRCKRTFGGRWAGCGGTSISLVAVERWIAEAVVVAVCSDDFATALNARQAALLAGDVSASQLDAWRAEISELEQVVSTRFGTPEHRTHLGELQRLVRQATVQLVQRPDLQALQGLPKTEEHLRQAWEGWDVAERRRVVKLLLARVVVKPVGPTGRRFNPERLVLDWKI